MKKNAKTFVAVIAVCGAIFTLNACQEDVYPEFDQNRLSTEKILDQQGETEDGDEDNGLDPK